MPAVLPKIEVRAVEPDDVHDFWRIVGTVYSEGQHWPEADRHDEHRQHFIALVDGVPAGAFDIFDYAMTRGLATLKNAGVALVAVLPEYRSSGVGSAMMRHAVEYAHKEGFAFASLYAYAERYYRRFGYEVCGGRMRFAVPISLMPTFPEGMPVRPIHCHDELIACYESYARQRSGMNLRDGFWWNRVIDKAMIYACGEPVEAFLVTHYRPGFHDQVEFRELIWNSKRGYETMLGFMSRLMANRRTLVWHEGLDSPFYYQYLPRRSVIEIQSSGTVMYRVIDPVRALEGLIPEASGAFTFRLTDGVVAANEGPWRVEFSPQGVSVAPAASADLEFDIRTFTQAVLGQPSLRDLIANDQVVVKDATGAENASQLLTPQQVALHDFF